MVARLRTETGQYGALENIRDRKGNRQGWALRSTETFQLDAK